MPLVNLSLISLSWDGLRDKPAEEAQERHWVDTLVVGKAVVAEKVAVEDNPAAVVEKDQQQAEPLAVQAVVITVQPAPLCQG